MADPKHGSGSHFYFDSNLAPDSYFPKFEVQCCGSASIIMRIRIRDLKNVHMDPDPDPRG